MKENQERGESFNEEERNLKGAMEVSPIIGENEVICVIKPDAFPMRDVIVRRLKEMGLTVVTRKDQQLTEPFIDKNMIAPEWSEEVREATKRYFMEGPSEFLVVRGGDKGDVIEKLIAATGGETNPLLCERDTIRFIYGDVQPEKLPGGRRYYRNAVHRPKNEEEAEEDKKKFGGVF